MCSFKGHLRLGAMAPAPDDPWRAVDAVRPVPTMAQP